MFDQSKFQAALKAYKEVFVEKQWPDEKYKWIAVKQFQENWDTEADDFPKMWMEATDKTDNLLASYNNFPRAMIRNFAQVDPEATRMMFFRLFNESKDIYERITQFIADSDVIREKHNPGSWTQHYQNMNSVMTYLWLRYPDKYYIYKYTEITNISKSLGSDFSPTKGIRPSNVNGFLKLYDSICDLLSEDMELTSMLKSSITEDCYADPKNKTLTIDFGYFISQTWLKEQERLEWYPLDYEPDLTIEDWVDLLNDPAVFTPSACAIVARFKHFGGSATCTQLSTRYGRTANFYNIGSSSLAKRVHKKTNIALNLRDNEKAKWWPILFTGKHATDEIDGSYIWRLREELNRALERFPWQEWVDNEESKEPSSYWWLNTNPRYWSPSEIAVGQSYSISFLNENGNYRRIHNNFLAARPDDLIILYESSPTMQIVAIGRITDETNQDDLFFEKIEMLSNPIPLSLLRQMPDLSEMEYFQTPQGSLFKLSEKEFDTIMDVIREENPDPKSRRVVDPYSKADFLSDVYLDEADYESLVHLLKYKKNIILQGAPGTGKTYAATRLAYSIMGEKDDSRIESIQFHQNYSYEDFVMGYRPNETGGFNLKQGIFYRFCIKASNEPDKDFFLIIDEINRGNLSRIFGELLMLIENGYRGKKLTLAYSGQSFSVPDNLHIIGLMNTADRSLAFIDYALRRRFSFFTMEPAFDRSGFRNYQEKFYNEAFNKLIETIRDLNLKIENDTSLGKGFCIGHSYFCKQEEFTDEWMLQVVNFELLPILREYWFDDKVAVENWERKFYEVLHD